MADGLRLAILGASVRAAAFSAVRAGFEVVGADLFADEDLRHLGAATRIQDYPQGFEDWLSNQQVDAWCYTGALENYPELVDRLAELRPLWGNRGEALRKARDPLEIARASREFGFHFPRTVADPTGLERDGSYLCKATRGSNGSGVRLLDGDPSSGQRAPVGAYYQQRVEGEPASAIYCIGENGAELLGLTHQIIGRAAWGAAPWAYCGSIARPLPTSESAINQLEAIGEALSSGFRLQGLVGVDLVIERGRIWAIEINPRYTASAEVVEAQMRTPAIAILASCFGAPGRKQDRAMPSASRSKAVLYAKKKLDVSTKFSEWALAQSARGRLADIPPGGTEIMPGEPVLTIFDQQMRNDALEHLDSRVVEVEDRLYARD